MNLSSEQGLPAMLTEDAVAAALSWADLIEAIEKTLGSTTSTSPERTVHHIEVPGGTDATLLLKPAWIAGATLGVKIVTYFPDQATTVQSAFVLFDATNGSLLGICPANELTARRTAAASAVAAKHLAKLETRRLLIVGTGALAPMMAQAHAHVRDYERIEVWGRRAGAAEVVVDQLCAIGLPAATSIDLDHSVAVADVVSCATGATTPLVRGAMLSPGTHLDLVGGFVPQMREADDDAIRSSTVFVDAISDATKAGDLAQPIAAGVMSQADIACELSDLISGEHIGRSSNEEITMFKSVGLAVEDLAAATLLF